MREHEDETMAEARALWQRYLVLTKELLKFIDRQDIDTFLAIVPQRGDIIEQMKALPPNGFRETQECKDMVEEIKPLDMQIIYKARSWLNKSRRQNSAVRSYDLTGANAVNAVNARGNIFNRSY